MRGRWSSYRRGATLLLREAASGVTATRAPSITEQVGDLSLQFFAGDFFQNNPFLLPRLVATSPPRRPPAARASWSTPTAAAACSPLAAAPGFERVLGVEVSSSAVGWARDNAARNGRTNCEFLAADASAVFAAVPFPAAETAVIVDPPRKGCGADFFGSSPPSRRARSSMSRAIPRRRPRPGGAARGRLRCLALQPFDMFPQTRHVECVATLTRSA